MMQAAVIGGGPAGIIAAIVLGKHVKTVDIYDPGKHFGGRTLTTVDDGVLLNTPVSISSMVYEDVNSFDRFLTCKNDPEESFVSRSLAKDYLKHLWTSQPKKDPGELINGTVTDIARDGDAYKVATDSGERSYDVVVIATGLPFLELEADTETPVVPAFPNDWLSGTDKKANVVIGGTSLSAVDTVLSLNRRAHEGRILLVGRSGMLPAVRRGIPRYTPLSKAEDPYEKIEHFMELLPDLGNQSPVEGFLTLFRQSKRGFTPWEKDVFWMAIELNQLFESISDEEKENIHDKCDSRLIRYLAAMPLQNAAILVEMFKSGQLNLLAHEVGTASDLAAIARDAFGTPPDLIVNALGTTRPVTSPLIAKLAHDKFVEINYRGGIKVCPHTCRVKGHEKLFALGPAIDGEIFVTNFFYATLQSANKLGLGMSEMA